MAISNLLGSNLFNMAILGVADVFYTKGPLLEAVSPYHVVSGIIGMMMTCVAIGGLVYRAERKPLIGVGLDTLGLLLLYLIGTYSLFILTGNRL
jgi:cation:H+ antiporter